MAALDLLELATSLHCGLVLEVEQVEPSIPTP